MAVVVHRSDSDETDAPETNTTTTDLENAAASPPTQKYGVVVVPIRLEDENLIIESVQLMNEVEAQETSVTPPPQTRMTFEEHFQKAEVQRIYHLRLFRFEMLLRFAVLIVSILCSTITFQKFYRKNKEMNRTIIIVCTAIFSLASAGLPYLFSKVKKWRRHPCQTTKLQMTAFVIQKMIYGALVSFWMDLVFLQVWINPIAASAETMPFLYTVPLCCTISLITHLVSPICLLFRKVRLTRCQNYTISHCILGIFLVISIDIIMNSSFQPKAWNWAQVGLATFLLEVEYVADLFIADETMPNKKCTTETCSGYDHASVARRLQQNV